MKFCSVVLFGLFISFSVLADDAALNEELSAAISRFLPDVEIDSIQPAPIKGLYQIIIGPDVIYMTRDGGYVVKGEILDINERRNLTEDVRAASRVKLLNSIENDEYIEFTGEDAHDAIYVFTDIDCGYCRKLHRDVPELNARGISVRYLAYPRAGVDSAAGQEMSNVWCSEDRQSALTAAKNRESIEAKTCDDPVAKQYALGQRIGVRGTPSIYLENGRNLPGYMPPDEIEEQLKLR
ncbi:MAG: DsbC family protein [Proteobacteria bacterium]|nr:DsbC family protein [Pseudomonadota bacterium]